MQKFVIFKTPDVEKSVIINEHADKKRKHCTHSHKENTYEIKQQQQNNKHFGKETKLLDNLSLFSSKNILNKTDLKTKREQTNNKKIRLTQTKSISLYYKYQLILCKNGQKQNTWT